MPSGASKPSRSSAYRTAKYGRRNTFNMEVDTSALDAILDDLGDKIEQAARPAAQAASQVFYEAVRANVSRLGTVTGSLYASIYQKFVEEQSGPGKATYTVSWRTGDAVFDANGQSVRTGLATAPHGHLVEFGHIQRYAVHLGADGKWYTLVRPSMRGKPRPKSNASQAEKDAYFVLRKGGPVQIAAKPFVRPAFYKQGQAVLAARDVLLDAVGAR